MTRTSCAWLEDGSFGESLKAKSVATAFSFGAAAVTGVDVDPDLIRRAHGHLSFQMSRMKPGEPAGSTLYFPVSSVLEHGHRPSLRRGEGVEQDDVSVLSNDVRFDCEDWVVVDASSPRQRRYDTILALSVVKWIHLQHLDAGLARFFSKCQTSLHLHGYLILEVQPWSSYEKAVRPHKSPHLAANLTQLEIRPDDFDDILLGLGFVKVRTSDELPRRIDIYQKVEED